MAQKNMKTISKSFILSAVVFAVLIFAVLFADSVNAVTTTCETYTFSNSDIYYSASRPGAISNCPSPCISACDAGSWYPNNATALKLCQEKGYDDLVSFTIQYGFYTSPYNNYEHQWNGSSFLNLCAITAGNAGIDTVTCSKNCNIACSSNSECGTNEHTGGPFCMGNSVYQNYKTYTCNNAGTSNSYCSNSTNSQLKSNCTGNQTCSNGLCSDQNITCSSNSACGTNAYVGSPFCQGNSVYQNYKTYTCNNTGTTNSYCSDSTAPKLKSACTSNQTCSNGSCSATPTPTPTIACSTNAQCGNNSLTGNPFCQGNNVFTNQLTYYCNNPGTPQSFCSNSFVPQLTKACGTNKICNNGDCASQSIACGSNADCGNNGLTGNSFCQDSGVYKNYITYSCNNPGTSQSFCSNSTTPQLTKTCSPTQNCVNGSCTNSQTIACSTNTQCGTNAYTGSPFCMGNSVYQNYRTYTCNNPGTSNSTCTNSTDAQLKTNCASGQTCSNGQCINQTNPTIVCSTNSQCGTNAYTGSPFCMGNSVYQNYITYICNNPGTSNSSCTNSTTTQLQTNCTSSQTCSNGYCSGQQNYITVQTNSATNTYNNQTTLNGYVSGINTNNTNYVWFQWGTTTSYGYNGYETNHQTINYTGSFSQNIAGLSPGVVYHFRAVGQTYNGQIVYGQDMTFQVGQVLGATDVNTGFTNNFLVDSFFLPLMIALAGIWLFKSGILNTGAWVDGKKMKHKDYIANKQLMAKISQIKERENR